MGTSARLLRTLRFIALVGALAAWLAPTACAEDAQGETFAAGRIYACISWRPPGQRPAIQIVAIDPQTGEFEAATMGGNAARVSPDGRRIAFTKSHGADSEVVIRRTGEDLEGSPIWNGEGNSEICWMNDGTHVLVSQYVRDGNRWKFTTWLVEAENGEATELKLPDTEGIVDCAHRSDQLISWSFRNPKSIELFTLRPDGSEAVDLTGKKQYDYFGRFSPDDSKIAFLRRQDGQMSVCTADADGKNVQIAFTEKGLTNPDGVTWSPDGKQLAVVLYDWTVDDQGRKVLRPETANYRLGIMNLDGSGFRDLKLAAPVEFTGRVLDWR